VLSRRATDAFEEARTTIQKHVGASKPEEIIFTKGCTEAINLVAHSWGRANLKEGDEVLLSHMEHHANIVPWQMAAEQTGAIIRPIPITDEGEIDLDAFKALLSGKTKLVGVKHVCNAMGTINPVKEITRMAKEVGATVLIDGAQALAHEHVDVIDIGADFYSMSGHKVYGPTGIGALYGRYELLNAMPPYQGGGDMIRTVSFEKTTYNSLPHRFEAGTPHVSGAIGFAVALKFLQSLGLEQVARHEHALTEETAQKLAVIPGVRLVGLAKNKTGIVSFVMDCAHPHDIGTIVDQEGVAIRTGHHCCMPLMVRLGVPATARASLALYNTSADVDALVRAVHRVREIFA